ncbi:MAG: hypothetical protein ACJ8LG_16670 [Massilia sp.]
MVELANILSTHRRLFVVTPANLHQPPVQQVPEARALLPITQKGDKGKEDQVGRRYDWHIGTHIHAGLCLSGRKEVLKNCTN